MPVKPIIPWLGGKRRLANKLISLFPPHECYVEVFGGGAALHPDIRRMFDSFTIKAAKNTAQRVCMEHRRPVRNL